MSSCFCIGGPNCCLIRKVDYHQSVKSPWDALLRKRKIKRRKNLKKRLTLSS